MDNEIDLGRCPMICHKEDLTVIERLSQERFLSYEAANIQELVNAQLSPGIRPRSSLAIPDSIYDRYQGM